MFSTFVLVCVLVASVDARCLASDLGLASPMMFSALYGGATSGADVSIDAGAVVLLDRAPASTLGTLTVSGTLVVDDSSSSALVLKSKAIVVGNGGKLLVGTASCRLDRDVTLQFVGALATSNKAVNFKALVAQSGSIVSLYGRDVTTSWANLAQTTAVGDRSIRLQQDVSDWLVGERIVLVSTSFLPQETETRRVASVDAATKRVTLDAPLAYVHFGNGWKRDSFDVNSMRGEVARLDRNVRIVGDDADNSFGADGFGAHTIVLSGARFNADGVQFERCGQRGILARYPVHFHLMGDTGAGSSVRHCSVFNSSQRAFVVHGSNGVALADNVAVSITGHAYFVEDANERDNVFSRNLAANVLPGALLPSDAQPAGFWLTHPQNRFIGNVAVAASFGFWLAFPELPLNGATPTVLDVKNAIWPQFTPMPAGSFDDNVAHSNLESGFFVDRAPQQDNTVNVGSWYQPMFTDFLDNSTTSFSNAMSAIRNDGDFGRSIYRRCLAYKNNLLGMWLRGFNQECQDCQFLDNHIGLEFAGENDRCINCLFVGLSENRGTGPFGPNQDQANNRYGIFAGDIYGYHFYHSVGPTTLAYCSFYDYVDVNLTFNGRATKRITGAITTDLSGNSVYPARSRFYGLKFFNVTHPVLFNPWRDRAFVEQQLQYWDNTIKGHTLGDLSTLMQDSDGSLTGKCGAHLVSRYNPLMIVAANECDMSAATQATFNAFVCSAKHPGIRALDISNGVGASGALFLHVIRPADDKRVALPITSDTVALHIVTNQTYVLHFSALNDSTSIGAERGNTPTTFRLNLRFAPAGEFLRVFVAFAAGAQVSSVAVQSDGGAFEPKLAPASSLTTLDANTYFYDGSTGLLAVQLDALVDGWLRQDSYSPIGNEFHRRIVITMNCGSACRATKSLDDVLALVKADAKSTTLDLGAPSFDVCGDLPYGGLPRFVAGGGDASVVFASQTGLSSQWKLIYGIGSTNRVDASNDVDVSPPQSGFGVKATVLQLNGGRGLEATSSGGFDTRAFTHLELSIRVESSTNGRRRETNAMIYIADNLAAKSYGVELSSPAFTAFGALSSDEYSVVWLPLERLFAASASLRAQLKQLIIVPSRMGRVGYRPTSFLISSMRFVNGSLTYPTLPRPTLFAGVDYAMRRQNLKAESRLGPGAPLDASSYVTVTTAATTTAATTTAATPTSGGTTTVSAIATPPTTLPANVSSNCVAGGDTSKCAAVCIVGEVGCPCGAGQTCRRAELRCGASGVCVFAPLYAIANCSAGVLGCQCDAGRCFSVGDVAVQCRDNECVRPTCTPGAFSCACVASLLACADANLACVTVGDAQHVCLFKQPSPTVAISQASRLQVKAFSVLLFAFAFFASSIAK